MITVGEAVALLNHWQYSLRIGGVDEVIRLVQEQGRLIEVAKIELDAEIGRRKAEAAGLKVCGNCAYWNWIAGHCTHEDKTILIRRRYNTCDNWDGET